MRTRSTTRADAGFTLVETLVALVILAAGVIALQEGLRLGWRGVRAANGETAAVALARRNLVEAGIATELAAGETSGSAPDGLAWTVTISTYDEAERAPSAGRLAGYWVRSQVRWIDASGAERSVSLATLKSRLVR